MIPKAIQKFIELFSRLPSIGRRQATRLGFFIAQSGKENVKELSHAVGELSKLKTCPDCFMTHDNTDDFCSICRDPSRNHAFVMVVEKETDLISLERTKKFHGRYLVLGEVKKDAILDQGQKMKIENLKYRIKKEFGGPIEEIIIAFNPTTVGDLKALMLMKEFQGVVKRITRLGRGIPTGGEIEFADEETLGSALDRRM